MDALVVVDMQKDFCYKNGALYIGDHVREIFEPIEKVIETAGERIPVFYTQDWHREDDIEFKIWPPHCVMNTEGAEIIDELKPVGGDYLIKKRRYSAFFGTDLDLTLRELNITRLFITGVATNICVLHTVSDAILLKYDVSVLRDCTATLNEYEYNYGLKHMSEVLNARIITSKDFIAGL
jgi:nicotinamidase-related amidase